MDTRTQNDLSNQLVTGKPVQALSPEGQDILLNNLYQLGAHVNLLSRLAQHYNVSVRELSDLLLSRQIVFLHHMTDYTKPGNASKLQEVVRTQQAGLARVVEDMSDRVSQADAVIQQAKFLNEEAAKILAMYKTKLLKMEVN